MENMFLFDGTALIYRAFFAFINNPLRNSKGENTSAIFGVTNTFLKVINIKKPDRIIISFDLKEPTFRQEISDTYKANRPAAPDEMISQVEPVKEFFKLLKIPEISLAGYEADDVLATLAERYKEDYQIVMITSDKDFIQLLDDRVSLYDPFSEKSLSPEKVKDKYGISYTQFVDYLAIMGDSSDNIPGVRGIGAKGASILLQQFTDLDNIYANLEKISSDSLRNKLVEGKEAAYLSKSLVKIERNVPLEEKLGIDLQQLPQDAIFKAEQIGEVIPLLKKYELNSIVKKLEQADLVSSQTDDNDQRPDDKQEDKDSDEQDDSGDVIQLSLDFYDDSKNPQVKAQIITDQSDLDNLFNNLKKQSVIAIGVVPSSRRGQHAKPGQEVDRIRNLIGISICSEENKAYYIPLNTSTGDILPVRSLIDKLNELPSEVIIAGHNIKEDYLILEKHGYILHEPLFDTMIASYLLDPSLPRHRLNDCAQRVFLYEISPIEDLLGSGKKKKNITEIEVGEIAPLAAEDANIIFRLYEQYKNRLESLGLNDLFYNIEMPLLIILAKMERDGVYIDCDILEEINNTIDKEIEKLTAAIFKIAGREFNINSTKQLSKVMFEELKIPPIKKTQTGYSTNNYVLEILAEDYEIARLLIDYRQLTKLKSTYVEALPSLIDKKTGRIHSSFNQTVTSTGRLSSSNPNLQNIPIRSKAGREIRKAFTVDNDEYLILSADYSQIELRILAILSRDRNLITAFNNKQDIHTQTAGLILNKPISVVTRDERRMAKAINFGIIYGMGPNKLSRETNISVAKAKEFIETYFTKFSRVKEYIQQQKNKAKQKGYAETIMGRRLAIPNIHNTNQKLRSEAERIAVNMPIQGTAADIIKIAMIRLDSEFSKLNEDVDAPLARMVIQVHDELVFEVHKSMLSEAEEIVVREMKKALPEKFRDIVPLAVESGSGKNWYEAHS